MRTLVEPTGLDSLTENQKNILRFYIELGTHKAVAHRLDRSVETVKATASTIFRKLDVDSITQACIMLDRAER